MRHEELADFLQYVGKDPSRLVFEDELTGIQNRRFLLSYFEHRVRWRSGEDFPLSLLFLDLDRFKEINDTHGHETGDQVLIWIAALLRDVAGEGGLPVRYGGDEFAVLLPDVDQAGARLVADRLLQGTRDRPFRERDTGAEIPVTVSIGVASAPDDATGGDELLNAADAALYFAKQSGKNRAASATDVDATTVFPHTALQRLKVRGVTGRSQELDLVEAALSDAAPGRCQLVLFEGAPGTGKTTLLDTVYGNLITDEGTRVAKASGDPREAGHPYYLATRILINLLNTLDDRGAALMDSIPAEARSHLSHVLPALVEGEPPAAEINPETRQEIFTTVLGLLGDVAEDRTVILLLDDMEFADEATLMLLRAAAQQRTFTFLVCGTVGESLRLSGEAGDSPLEQLFEDSPSELAIRRAIMSPLGPEDIVEHLLDLFPNVRLPENAGEVLAQVTGGNPFFLTEIVHGLLEDQKIRLVGRDWVLKDVEAEYLARSLEEIVTAKISAFDEEDRRILERATTLGEEVPLSVLAGSTELDETRVHEFLDRAEALGLVSVDFQVNDEMMHFLGKRIIEISYAAMSDERRLEIHEEVGRYQEGLYEQRLLPSASILAYHFRRASNETKAQKYEGVQRTYAASVFEAGEAANYLDDREALDPGAPLGPRALGFVPQVLRTVLSGVRNVQLYPAESEAISRALSQTAAALEAIHEQTDRLTITHSDDLLQVNGEGLDLPESAGLAGATLNLFLSVELSGLAFSRGVTEDELRALFEAFAAVKPGSLNQDFWKDKAAELGLGGIEVRQLRFTHRPTEGETGNGKPPVEPLGDLRSGDVEMIPVVLRDLLKAASDVRLYPVGSERVGESVLALMEGLRPVLDRVPAFTIAHIGTFVLANGIRIDTTDWQAVAVGFVEFLNSAGLESLTFYPGLTNDDVEAFLAALAELPPGGGEPELWHRIASERGISGMAFNQATYAMAALQGTIPDTVDGGVAETEADGGPKGGTDPGAPSVLEEAERVTEESVVRVAKDLLVQGRQDDVQELLQRLFAGFELADVHERAETVHILGTLHEEVVPGLQHTLAVLSVDPLTEVMAGERDPKVLSVLGALVYVMAASAVQFSDYQLAGRLYAVVSSRRQGLSTLGEGRSAPFDALGRLSIDDSTQQLLAEDLRSGRSDRQQRASLVLSSVGSSAIPLLVGIIKQGGDLRARQLAAGVLAELGDRAAEELKETLLTEVLVEQRYRVLEVVDLVTRDLRTELAFSIADESPKIRRAAFQLFERLKDDELIDLILPLLEDGEPSIAKGAIRSLTDLGTPGAAEALIQTLRSTKDPGLAAVCCQALGRLRVVYAVDALANVLSEKKLRFFGYKWQEHVRAAAAVALSQIGGPAATTVLSAYVDDPSTRIREVARKPPRNDTDPA